MTSPHAHRIGGILGGSLSRSFLLLGAGLVVVACASNPPTAGDELEAAREAVRKQVVDVDRQSEMLKLLDQQEAAFEELGSLVDRDRRAFLEMLADYATTRDDIEGFFATHREKRVVAARQVADLHFEFKSLATPEEWKKLGKIERKALELIAQRSLVEASFVE